jgi:hypothetical protein
MTEMALAEAGTEPNEPLSARRLKLNRRECLPGKTM